MKNTIRTIKQNEVEEIRSYFKEKGAKGVLVELNGKDLRTWQQYSEEIGEKFCFPAMYKESERENAVPSYLDWIRDLTWFTEVDEFAIIIYNHGNLAIDQRNRVREGVDGSKYIYNNDMIIATFVTVVLPWWEYDVEKNQVGGKAKAFNVNLAE